MKECNLRGQLDGPLQVLDCLAKLAVLMGNQAEQMLSFMQIRLRLEHLPADCFGLRQPAFAAIPLREHQRLPERHRFRRHVPAPEA